MIRLENVSKRYQMGKFAVTALDHVSLEIDKGEFVVVLGPSGSGKTTLLNLISALDVATEGLLEVNDTAITQARHTDFFKFRRETVSFIFQSFNLFPSLTALENVQFVLDMMNHRHDARECAQKVLRDVGLGSRENHFPHELSGGE